MTLREQMQADVTSVFLNTDEHGEEVTYRPKGGAERSVIAIVDEDATSADIDSVRHDAEQIMVFVYRDPTGIDNPQAGDLLVVTRAGQEIEYKYAGTREDADEFSWWLRFLRVGTNRMGGNVRSK